MLKLLSKSPEKRHQTGEELQRTLRRFLNAYAPDFSSSDLSHVSKELFQREIVEDRKKIQRLNERVEQLLQNDIPEIHSPTGENPGGKREETTTFVARPTGLPKGPLELKMEDEPRNQAPLVMERPARPMPPRPTAASPRDATRVATPMPGGPVPAGGGTYAKTGTTIGRTGGYYPPESSSGFGMRGIAAAVVALVLGSWGAPKMGWFEVPVLSGMFGSHLPKRDIASEDKPKPDPDTNVSPADPVSESKPAKLRLNIFPEGADTKISVNGFVVDPAKPVIDVRTDSLVTLSVQRPGFETFRSEFSIDSRSLASTGEYLKEISLEPERGREPTMVIQGDNRGFLTVRSTPGADAKIFVNGKYWGRKYAPFEMLPVPVGKLDVQFYNSTLDLEDKVAIEIEKNRTKQVQSNLRPRKH